MGDENGMGEDLTPDGKVSTNFNFSQYNDFSVVQKYELFVTNNDFKSKPAKG